MILCLHFTRIKYWSLNVACFLSVLSINHEGSYSILIGSMVQYLMVHGLSKVYSSLSLTSPVSILFCGILYLSYIFGSSWQLVYVYENVDISFSLFLSWLIDTILYLYFCFRETVEKTSDVELQRLLRRIDW